MKPHAIGHLSCKAKRMGPNSGQRDRRHRQPQRRRREPRRHQSERIVFPLEAQLSAGLPGRPDGTQRLHVFPQTGERLKATQGVLKRLSLCARICVPRPRTNRPREAICKSQEAWATTIGLRGNAMATAVPSPMRVVETAATPNARNGSFWLSWVITHQSRWLRRFSRRPEPPASHSEAGL